ncbi:MAG TPA: SGNH/GDSL hydrolase family protein [Gemmatimonadaceae bacterium]|nr:SGNH/GDSL hydrolase family protein [Gemmatimonadaceae bacterium]
MRIVALFAGLALLTAATSSPHAPARYLALGDSYTIGEGVSDSARWPVQLARALRKAGADVADPDIIARTGWTTDELDRAITERNVTGPYALVTLLIGVNNQYRGRSVDEYRPQFAALLKRAIGFAGGSAARVIVVSIPDWGVTPFNKNRDKATVAREIDGFNAAALQICRAEGVTYVDITDLTRAEPAAVVADGLHPSEAMYARWVQRLVPPARAILQTR